MKKSAFTLAEVLIALGIVGVVVTFGIKASVENDKGIRHIYSNTYYALDRAFYNAMLYPKNPNPFEWKTVIEGVQGSIYENGFYICGTEKEDKCDIVMNKKCVRCLNNYYTFIL